MLCVVKNKYKNKNKNKNEKYVELGTSLENSFVLYNHGHQTNTKLLVVAFLYDNDNKVSHPLVRSLDSI